MQLEKFEVSGSPQFKLYLLSDRLVKGICKEFTFYSVKFYREEKCKKLKVILDYPKGNVYWFIDFKKFIVNNILTKDATYEKEWEYLLQELKRQVAKEFKSLEESLKLVSRKKVIDYMLKYNLRDYQAFDLAQLLIKMNLNTPKAGLILSEQRTGKTRVALAASLELVPKGSTILVICPKSAQIGWMDEIIKMRDYDNSDEFRGGTITKVKQLLDMYEHFDENCYNVRIISYDFLKRFSITQLKALLGIKKSKHVVIIGDEIHRLRNFKTLQSTTLFNIKELCQTQKLDFSLLGLTGTPAIKDSYDIFGILSFINSSKIRFSPHYIAFNDFKEYFYNCEDTSFGKICKSLRREHELNFLIQSCAVQTKQKDLELFQNYTKVYKKIELPMEDEQSKIYQAVAEEMEYGEEIDCENSLVQLVRLQQICIDPSVLVSSYATTAPKLKWISEFIKKYDKIPIIIMSKRLQVLKKLNELCKNELGISTSFLYGMMTLETRNTEIKNFKSGKSKVFLIQLDVGKEALTLPEAQCTIFLDRDFAQGYNEQAEARMTPMDGSTCKKLVIDLVMKDTVEDAIYERLVVRKESIKSINDVY